MLAGEAVSRIRWPDGSGWSLARFGGADTVALGFAVISYGHLRSVLVAWQYISLAAAVGPLVLDGLMVVCGFAPLANSVTSQRQTTTGEAGSWIGWPRDIASQSEPGPAFAQGTARHFHQLMKQLDYLWRQGQPHTTSRPLQCPDHQP
jgi:hypothetical protein